MWRPSWWPVSPTSACWPSGADIDDRPLADRLAERIRSSGPLPFDEWVEACLYDEAGGFYASGGAAGRRGDFLTSPEVGPLFGSVVARWLDSRWEALGRPANFTVVEAAAGVGTLARSIRDAQPACLIAGQHILVERSAALRSQQPADERVRSVADLAEAFSREQVPGVVLANELLDNLAFGLLEATDGRWHEVRVDVDQTGGFVEVRGPVTEPPVFVEPKDGARIPVQAEAARWVSTARSSLSDGSVLVVDYASSTGEMASRPWTDWLRTYRGHGRGGPATAIPGGQDVTAEVAVDQLPSGAVTTNQATFLGQYGIDHLVEEGRRVWKERAGLGDLEALRARSRVVEAEALLDIDGLGGFTVLEWSAAAGDG